MDKEVVISIKGMQKYEDTFPDVVELVTAGRLAREGESYTCLLYTSPSPRDPG